MTKTALIVVDMQNSFLHPDGENHYATAPGVIDPINTLISTAAANNTLIVHVADRHRAGFADFEDKHLPRHCASGGFNAEYFDGFGPRGRRNEIEIVKRRFSAFFATELALFLNEQNIRRVILCGVKTNVCIRLLRRMHLPMVSKWLWCVMQQIPTARILPRPHWRILNDIWVR